MAVMSVQNITPDLEEYGDFNTRIHLDTVTFYDVNTYEKLRTIKLDQKIRCGSSGKLYLLQFKIN